MGTPSEVLAGRLLQKILKTKEIKFVNESFDFTASDKEGLDYCIEVKSGNEFRFRQMNALAQEFSKGKMCLLFVVDEHTGHYCLFKLVGSDLFPSPLKKTKVYKRRVRIQNNEEQEFVSQVVSNYRFTVPSKVCKLLKLQEGDFVRIKISKEKR